MTNHLITPPPKLVQQWYRDAEHQLAPYYVFVARCAAQWGADQELKACCEWLYSRCLISGAVELLAARRPKPSSLKGLKEQALKDLNHAYKKDQIDDITFENIQEALEALPND
jgi:hypothetical protein